MKTIIEKIDEKQGLERVGNDLHRNGMPVVPEILSLSKVPFSYFATIRFTGKLKNKNNESGRRMLLDDIIFFLNLKIKLKHPDIISGKWTVNYVAVEEYAETLDDVHVHILYHVHPAAADIVEVGEDISNFFQKLKNPKYIATVGGVEEHQIESVDVQAISDRDGLVGYLTKIEKGRVREGKKFHFSIGFLKKIAKFYL